MIPKLEPELVAKSVKSVLKVKVTLRPRTAVQWPPKVSAAYPM